jgi:hypothetical protein
MGGTGKNALILLNTEVTEEAQSAQGESGFLCESCTSLASDLVTHALFPEQIKPVTKLIGKIEDICIYRYSATKTKLVKL